MGFFPHILLQDSFSFFEFTGKSRGENLRWNYDSGRVFQVEGDRGSIQRLMLVCLQYYIECTPTIDLTIGTLVQQSAPFSPALTLQVRPEFVTQFEQYLNGDKGTKKLLSENRIALYQEKILFPIDTILYDEMLPPIDFLDLRTKYDVEEDASLLLQLFFESVDQRIEKLKDYLRNGESKDAHRIAHSIKGGALSISAHQVAGIAKEMELQLKKGKGTDKVASAIPELIKATEKAREYWKELKKRELNT